MYYRCTTRKIYVNFLEMFRTNSKLTRAVDIGNGYDLDHVINLYITIHNNH